MSSLEETNQDLARRNAQILEEVEEATSQLRKKDGHIRRLKGLIAKKVEELQERTVQLVHFDDRVTQAEGSVARLTVKVSHQSSSAAEAEDKLAHQIDLGTILLEKGYTYAQGVITAKHPEFDLGWMEQGFNKEAALRCYQEVLDYWASQPAEAGDDGGDNGGGEVGGSH